MFRLTLQNLFDQIVDNVAVVAGERLSEARNIPAALNRERG